MHLEPLAIGVCSWSLRTTSISELKTLLARLGIDVVQLACGDPNHAAWEEGDNLPAVASAAGFQMTGAMIGFPGEDYTSPQMIQRTGGFGDPATRPERLDRFRWALARTRALGLHDLTCHAGFIPPVGDPARKSFLDTLAQVSDQAKSQEVIVAFETGQETADLLRRTLDDLQCANLKVNFDPANMLLYDKGDPLKAIEILAPDIRSVHVKDANRPLTPGTWGEELPLGQGQVNIPRFLHTLRRAGYQGPLCIERERGNQEQRLADIALGIRLLRECIGK